MIASQNFYRKLARRASLIYITDEEPGIVRCRRGKGFCYVDPKGKALKDPKRRRWIESLAIPPAWQNVWICPVEEGHLLATGRDDRLRKQYRYHPRWHEVAGQAKFASLFDFAAALPRIRRRVKVDLESPEPRTRALAAIVRLIDRARLRVGGEAYAKENGSHGAVTLESRHVHVFGDRIHLKFRAKHAIVQEIDLYDDQLAYALKRLAKTRTRRLFAYTDRSGKVRKLSSGDVNQYLKSISGADVTAKDFRTWHGSVIALVSLTAHVGERPLKKHANEAIRAAATALGNTLATCRKHYVHPGVIAAFADGSLESALRKPLPRAPLLGKEERLLVSLLDGANE